MIHLKRTAMAFVTIAALIALLLCASAEGAADGIAARMRESLEQVSGLLSMNNAALDSTSAAYGQASGTYTGDITMIYDFRDADPVEDGKHIKSLSALVAYYASEACPEVSVMMVYWVLPRYDDVAMVRFEVDRGDYHYRGVKLPDYMN